MIYENGSPGQPHGGAGSPQGRGKEVEGGEAQTPNAFLKLINQTVFSFLWRWSGQERREKQGMLFYQAPL